MKNNQEFYQDNVYHIATGNKFNDRIKAICVKGSQQLAFLSKYLDKLALVSERGIYNTLRSLSPDYTGGFWNFYELSNGGFYMAPNLDERLQMCVPGNYFDGILSADAAGIVACIFFLNHLCFAYKEEKHTNQYYWLLDFAYEHAEAKKICRAID